MYAKKKTFDLDSFIDKSYNEQIKMINKNPEIINYKDSIGNNILFSAIEKNNYNLVKFIIEKNPQLINFQNNHKETSLHKAVNIVNHRIINLLLENNANPNLQNEIGETPLHLAAYKGEYKVIKLLLLYNCDPKIKTNDGFSAEDYASERGYTKSVSVLQEKTHGKKISSLSNFSKSEFSDNNVANGMEKSPLSHFNNHKVLNICKSNRSFNEKNIHQSILNNFSENNIIKIRGINTLENNSNDFFTNEKINNERISDIDNNILKNSKIFITADVNKIKNPFQFSSSFINNNEKSINNISEEANVSCFEYFEDKDDVIRVFSSKKNDILSNESYTKRESSIKKTYRRDNTLRNSKIKNPIIQKEEKEFMHQFSSFTSNNSQSYIKVESNNNYNLSRNNIKNIYLTGSTSLKINENEEEILTEYLSQIHMEKYAPLLIKEGFDDITMMIEQMKGKKSILDNDLKIIGVLNAGDRAKILIKFHLDSKDDNFKFNSNIDENAIFHYASEIDYINDHYLNILYKWLESIKLQKFFNNFYNQGYHSLDLLLIQMLSKNPLTDEILKEDIDIDKYGYRLRLLNKLLEDSSIFMQKYKSLITNETINSYAINFENDNEKNLSCKCFIF